MVGSILYLGVSILHGGDINPPAAYVNAAGFLYAVLVVPLIEELFFRFSLWRVLRLYTAPPGAVIFSTAAFAAFHAGRQIFLMSMVASLLFLFLYLYLKNISYAVIAHATYNSMVWMSIPFHVSLIVVFILGLFLLLFLAGQKKVCADESTLNIFKEAGIIQ